MNDQRGFTLAEMAIVLLLLGILAGMGLAATGALREQIALKVTRAAFKDVRERLVIHLGRHGRLPCPDAGFIVAGGPPDGMQDRRDPDDPRSPCLRESGVLPFGSLGLPRKTALDGWQNLFSYRPAPAWTTMAEIRSGFSGEAAVILSHGPDGLGAYTVKGYRNALPADASGIRDDLSRPLRADDLLGPLIRQGVVQPPEAQMREQFQQLSRTAMRRAWTTFCALPESLPDRLPDPWGQPYRYRRLPAGERVDTVVPADETPLFELLSPGAERRFVLTAGAYRDALVANGLWGRFDAACGGGEAS